SKVVPLTPEFIAKQDGAEKQDCERNAVKRWLEKHAARLKPLRPAYLADDLFACQSVAKRLGDTGDDVIFTCKETSHKALYDIIACGRARWKIENESFNVLKNHGYELEHNFGAARPIWP